MLDRVRKEMYYYIVTDDESSGKFTYEISDFIGMGSSNAPFNETAANLSYYISGQDIVYENYIFHVDFKEAKVRSGHGKS